MTFMIATEVVNPKLWAGNLPCVHGPSEGCNRHNPRKQPIAYNARLPSDQKSPSFTERLFGPPKIRQHDEVVRSERIWSTLYLDHSAADPLISMHPSIHYALAYYHLHWVFSAATPKEQNERADILACNGTVPGNGKRRPDFEYWINPYFYKHLFLLQHTIRFVIEPKDLGSVSGIDMARLDSHQWSFQCCPHIRHRFLWYTIEKTRGLVKANMTYETERSGSVPVATDGSTTTRWESIYGASSKDWYCRHCSADGQVYIRMVEDKIVVQIHVWRDLGDASGPYHLNWLAGLRYKSIVCRRASTEPSWIRNCISEAKKEARASRSKR
ncbi:hypothetical protein F4819DRAFT_500083 [Hypoxylon fuscum]|nr:hypothetical protein F4819DRAFT_500083 [Hypoxylon fuscum]